MLDIFLLKNAFCGYNLTCGRHWALERVFEFDKLIGELRSLGTEQNRALYRKLGATGEILGVSLANIDMYRRRILRDHNLAHELWNSGIVDARCLATLIADPMKFTENELASWAADINYYPLADYFVSNIVIRNKSARKLSLKWTKSKDEYILRCAYAAIGILTDRGAFSDEELGSVLSKIRIDYFFSPSLAKEAMNGALIEIGKVASIQDKALELAEFIRKTEIAYLELGDDALKSALAHLRPAERGRFAKRTNGL